MINWRIFFLILISTRSDRKASSYFEKSWERTAQLNIIWNSKWQLLRMRKQTLFLRVTQQWDDIGWFCVLCDIHNDFFCSYRWRNTVSPRPVSTKSNPIMAASDFLHSLKISLMMKDWGFKPVKHLPKESMSRQMTAISKDNFAERSYHQRSHLHRTPIWVHSRPQLEVV